MTTSPLNSSPAWADLEEADLLRYRLCDLRLTIEGSGLEEQIQQLYAELSAKGILFRPEFYLGDEWFVPEGDTVISIPFYLAHPRLKRLEQSMMLEAEGETKAECLKLLRHETGHALYYAYLLNRNRELKSLFGHTRETPGAFRPKPYSKAFVLHLDNHYAQTEPDEDFAETFAVWLDPDSDWENRYKGWKALKKLQFIDPLMQSLAGAEPPNKSNDKPYSAAHSAMKLATYYRKKRKEYEEDYVDFFDNDLKRMFLTEPTLDLNESAMAFLKRYKKRIIDRVAFWSCEKKYRIDQVYASLLDRTKALTLYLAKPETESALDVAAFLATVILNRFFTGKFKRK